MKAIGAAAVALACWNGCAAAQGPQRAAVRDLADLSLEQLSSIVVTTVSGHAQELGAAPASIFVLSGEDIRRSGATTLPEALRLAPNLQVARINAAQYAISARGFNGTAANKLQVLIDGRTVYSPLFSGTFWEAQDVLLEDVERIEVISGPGGTLWGANAVNGVINVITKSAAETQRSLVSAGAGGTGRGLSARHGGALVDGHYRVYMRGWRRDNSWGPDGTALRDRNDHLQLGFRADWARGADSLTLQGDAHGADVDQPAPAVAAREFAGANLLARWTRRLGGGEELRVQGYYDRTVRDQPNLFKERLDTFDVEVRHALSPAGAHRILWGFGARHHRDRVQNRPGFAFLPGDKNLLQTHVFVQDEIALRPDLTLTPGVKVDRNSYTGAELLPSVRLAWRAAPAHLLWTALSRAVRAPSRFDRELFVTPGLAGGPGFVSEISNVAEAGYRGQPSPRLSWSVTAFYADHDRHRSLAPTPAGPRFGNDLEGSSAGVEAWATWRPLDWWRLSGGLTRLSRDLRPRAGALDVQPPSLIGSDPHHWWTLRSAFDIGEAHELDLMLRHHGPIANRSVPAYTAIDARLGWRVSRRLELSLGVENLLDAGHIEWAPGAELQRSAYLRARVDF